jgi:hypothetical protein
VPDPRPDLASIRRDYQVPDDALVTYRPRLYGAVDIPFTEGRQMTRTEGELLDRLTFERGLLGLSAFRDIARDAFTQGAEHYPDNTVVEGVPNGRAREWQGNDGHRDAFRHAYWSARLAQEYGSEWARAFTSAHEGLEGNWANREAMDLYNNSIGIQIGASNRHASPERIAELVEQAVSAGRTVVIDRTGNLEWSDRVTVGQHGLSREDVIGPHMQTPGVVPTDHKSTAALAPDIEGDGKRFAAAGDDKHSLVARLGTSASQGEAELAAALRDLQATDAGRAFDARVQAQRADLREQDLAAALDAQRQGPARA